MALFTADSKVLYDYELLTMMLLKGPPCWWSHSKQRALSSHSCWRQIRWILFLCSLQTSFI
jgi:hypothetical protein